MLYILRLLCDHYKTSARSSYNSLVTQTAWGSEDDITITGTTYSKGPVNHRYHDFDSWFMDLGDMVPDRFSYYNILTTHVAIPLSHAEILVSL